MGDCASGATPDYTLGYGAIEEFTIGYIVSRYRSLNRVAHDYIYQLRHSCRVCEASSEASVVILHCLSAELVEALQRLAEHRRGERPYLVGYLVWEADRLPKVLEEAISALDEVWSCSAYSCSVFSRSHRTVYKVPHIVSPLPACSAITRFLVRKLIGFDPRYKYFLAMGSNACDRRKNVTLIIKTFERLRSVLPNARLIVKGMPRSSAAVRYGGLSGNVVYLNAYLTRAQLRALYECCTAVVSAHHSEAWGLALSDAQAIGVPVIATGYSGNLEYMTQHNSILLPYRHEVIHDEDRFYLFDDTMRWAYPDEAQLAQQIVNAYHEDEDGRAVRITQAHADIQRFRPIAIRDLLRDHVVRLCDIRGLKAPSTAHITL